MARIKIEYYSGVNAQGKILQSVQDKIDAELILFAEKHIKITYEVVKNTRSLRQNNFYHGYYIPSQQACFLERWGEIFTPAMVHTWNKANVWCTEMVDTTGEIFKIPDSSTKPTPAEFEQRLEMGRQFFWDKFEWQLPMPKHQPDFDFENNK